MENTFTTMAPPKLGVSSQNCRRPRSNVRTPQEQEETKEQQPRHTKFVNLDEISSPNMAPGSPTLVVEETQQKIPMGMDIDMPEIGQSQQTQDTGNPSHSENPE
jgi:hypothetical protein